MVEQNPGQNAHDREIRSIELRSRPGFARRLLRNFPRGKTLSSRTGLPHSASVPA